ncbi:Flavin carrier protein 2 [Paramyrothecium foliicola]|nr:Flavin carrier protein 2 [Paramyrothecium foliicola]
MAGCGSRWNAWRLVTAVAVLATGVLGDDILRTSGFTECTKNTAVKVEKVDLSYNSSNKTIIFDVAGSSEKQQNVSAVLEVKAYGNDIYSETFNPCDSKTFVERLCPVPEGNFAANGKLAIPEKYASMVPAIAFQIPDIAALATLKLISAENGEEVACLKAEISNGKSVNIPAIPYVAAGIAGAALVLSAVSAAGAALAGGGVGGVGTTSPGFGEVIGHLQFIATSGMMSVNYPPVYRSFTTNFAFSTGIIPWTRLQEGIDAFRARTGGNLTISSVEYLKKATLVYPDGSTVSPQQQSAKIKRSLETFAAVLARQADVSVGEGGQDGGSGASDVKSVMSGIQGYVEQLAVPDTNVFMNILLVVAILIAAIIVGILLVKVILEVWAIWGSFPEALKGFRKHYWGTIARTITSLILVLYGIWVLYCLFQFIKGDSWAAQALAGVTLAIFTAILAFFSWKIWSTARKLKNEEGDTSALYDDKSLWTKYSIFYDAYRKDYWWIFVPTIIYMLIKGIALAVGDGHGMAQTVAMIAIEGAMLIMLLWSRPYERRSGNVINIVIQVVRVLSVVCILVFVEEFGIRQTTQTVTGVVLIVVQSTLTGILAILIAWNAINACCKENPHRKRRKEMEKLQRDTLTPLSARNSLLLDRPGSGQNKTMLSLPRLNTTEKSQGYQNVRDPYAAEDGLQPPMAPSGGPMYRPLTPTTYNDVRQSLITTAAPFGQQQPPTRYNQGYRFGDEGYRGF